MGKKFYGSIDKTLSRLAIATQIWGRVLVCMATSGLAICASSSASAQTLYQVTSPSGQISVTDSIDTAYQLSEGNTQRIKMLDTLSASPFTEVKNSTVNTLANPATASVPLPPQNTLSPPPPLSSNASIPTEKLSAPLSKVSQIGQYQLQIITPSHEMVYHRPAQAIEIGVHVSPALQQGDSIAYVIDGKKIAQTQDLTLEISSQEIPLDKHTLQIDVVNLLNQPIATAQADFYVTQNTIAMQKRRKLEQLKEQLEAYDDLPWYQKIAVRLGIQKK